MNDEEKKQEILDLLKKEGGLAISEISFRVKTNYYRTKSLLGELRDNSKIVSEKRNRGIYWGLKKK